MPRPLDAISADQRARLHRARDRRDRELVRFRAVVAALVDEGASPAAIARELGVTRQAIYQLLKRAR